jgi:hypothetical protein
MGSNPGLREFHCMYKILVAKPEGKILSLRPRHNWKDNIKMYQEEIGFYAVYIVLNFDSSYSGYSGRFL